MLQKLLLICDLAKVAITYDILIKIKLRIDVESKVSNKVLFSALKLCHY